MEKIVHASARLDSGFKVTALINDMEVIMDHPADRDGEGAGPLPGQLLACALMGCKAMVARAYLNKKGLPQKSIEVKLISKSDSVPAKGTITQSYHTTVVVDADLSSEELEELHAYIDKYCTVGLLLKQENTLSGEVILKGQDDE